MKILITGTNGFVGRNLKEYFQDRYENLDCPKRDKLNLTDSNAVNSYLYKSEFDLIIHCAITLTSVEDNLKMYMNLEQCSHVFGKLLCIGSGGEFDNNNYRPRMRESYFGRHIPTDIYGFSKYVIAKDIESVRRNIYNLRVFGIFGKYEDYKRRFISNNICRSLCGLPLSINKNMFFDYLYIEDFKKIVDRFISAKPKYRTYNLCTGSSIDLLTLANLINRIAGSRLPVKIIETGLKPEYTGDNSLFQNEFGPFTFTPFENSIGELYSWYKDDSHIELEPRMFS